jgi:hypothetical protein
MAKLARAVIIRDPDRARDLHFQPGEEPAPEYAVLIRNPACWEGGKLPTAVKRAIAAKDEQDSQQPGTTAEQEPGPTEDSQDSGSGDDSSSDAAQSAKKTAARKTAASNRSRGRAAADEGTSGE